MEQGRWPEAARTGKKIAFTLLGIAISYFGAALGALVNVGQGPVSAFFLTGSYAAGIGMGTVSVFFQSIFIVGQILLERKDFKPIQFLQILNVAFGGWVLNFFLYRVFAGVVIEAYWLRLLLGTLSFAVNAVGVVIVLEADFVRVPLEGFLSLIARRSGKKLGRLKQIFDFSLIALNLLISLIGGFPITIREGTVINAVVFGAVLDWTKKPIAWLYRRWGVVNPPATAPPSGVVAGNNT